MKLKYLWLLLLLLLLVFILVWCSRKPAIESCATNPDDEPIFLSENASQLIEDTWKEGNWKISVTQSEYDYVFETSKGTIRYSSHVGIFNNITKHKHLKLSNRQKNAINAFLEEAKLSP